MSLPADESGRVQDRRRADDLGRSRPRPKSHTQDPERRGGRTKLKLRERRAVTAGVSARETREITLADTLDRVLSRGVVARAEVVLSVAEVPLLYVGLQALVGSVETIAQMSEHTTGIAPQTGARNKACDER